MVDIRVQVIVVTRALTTLPPASETMVRRAGDHLKLVVKGNDTLKEVIKRHLSRVLLSNMSRESAASVVNAIEWELEQ